MAEGQQVACPKKITVNVKISKEKQSVMIEEIATIKEFKEAVSKEKFNAQADQLCLIFAGKIMKDHEILGRHNIKDGLAVHLVIKAPCTATTQNQESNSASIPQADVGASPFGLGSLGGLMGIPWFRIGQFHRFTARHATEVVLELGHDASSA